MDIDTTEPYRLAVVVGSIREGRFGPTVAGWFAARAARRAGIDVDVVDLADPTAGFGDRIAAADAVVVVTPEYNHSFPGPLKAAIDDTGREWRAKPVAFVAYGGLSGGLRAVEALRPVFAELHATTIRDTVSFHGAAERFDADGDPRDAGAANGAADVLLDELGWWARTLRAMRHERSVAPSGAAVA
jgi:NAD(P)H-dependent FMN reductase